MFNMKNEIVGALWNDKEIDIARIDGRFFSLYGWNGEEYLHCWEVKDEKGLDKVSDDEYEIKPIFSETEDEYGNFDLIDFEIK